MTVKEALKVTTSYPVSDAVLIDLAERRGLVATDEVDRKAASFELAVADLMVWVSYAPNISEGGSSFNVPLSDRKQMRDNANRIYGRHNDPLYVQSDIRNVFSFQGDDV